MTSVTTGQSPREALAEAMRDALRNVARSVAIVSMRKGDELLAMTATALTEVSLDPPSMLVCLNRSSSMGTVIEEGDIFAVNLLSAGQVELSRACGGSARGSERFQLAGWLPDASPPTIEGACAVIWLRSVQIVDHGSHRVVIGNIEDVAIAAGADPLIYHAGAYRNLARQ